MTHISFPADSSDLDGSEDLRREYIKALLEVSGDDARHVTLMVSVSLGAVLVVVAQMPINEILALPLAIRVLLVAGVALLALGALSVFRYCRAIHLARLGISRCVASADARHARQIWAGAEGIWVTKGIYYRLGIRAMAMGFVLVAIAIGYLFINGRAS